MGSTVKRFRLDNYIPILLIAPCLGYIFFFTIFPAAYSMALSLFSWHFLTEEAPTFVGIDNFVKAFTDLRFLISLRNTFLIGVMATSIELLLGLFLALYLNKNGLFYSVARVICLLPMMATPVGISWSWRMLFNERYGLFNKFVSLFAGKALPFLSDPSLAVFSIIFVDVWQWTSFMFLLTSAAVQSLPREPLEAAEVFGASEWQKIRYIVLPMISPVLLVAFLLRFLEALKIFDPVFVLTGGGPGYSSETITFYTYFVTMKFWSLGYASAIAYIFYALTFILSLMVIVQIRGRIRG
ncbi:MAG: sugar ABC transporter permease [Aigarchaeota archaeon]|nr:sugar ABC transporter permease [Candidatus Wolframiiraptor gerlachensis]